MDPNKGPARLEPAELNRAVEQLAGVLARRRTRLQDDLRRAAQEVERSDPTEVAFDLATRYRELRVLGGLLQAEPGRRLELLQGAGRLDVRDARQVLLLLDELELAPKLVDALSWVLPPWFVRPEGAAPAQQRINLVLFYAQRDRPLAEALELHLRPLQQHEGAIAVWSERHVRAGEDYQQAIDQALERAAVVLVLVSADLLADGQQMARVQEALRQGKRVVPVVVRAVMLQGTPLEPLVVLPRNGRPIAASRDQDAAWLEVATEIRALIASLQQAPPSAAASPSPTPDGQRGTRAQQEPQPIFSWLHVSDLDIGSSNPGWDQGLVRSALRRDVVSHLEQRGRYPLDAVLVSGDIAFSGVEYDEAERYLHGLAQDLGLGDENVFVVPGNHDVDRRGDSDRQKRRLLRSLREGEESLDEALVDERDRPLLLERQAAYRAFALRFGPPSLAALSPQVAWTHTMAAAAHSNVRLYGLNTALLTADGNDHGKLRLGLTQRDYVAPPQPRELVILLSHHPFQGGWLADEKRVDAWMSDRAHVHVHSTLHEATPMPRAGAPVRVAAGGMASSWCYNLATVLRMPDGTLRLRIWPRRWDAARKGFLADHGDAPPFTEHELGLRLP